MTLINDLIEQIKSYYDLIVAFLPKLLIALAVTAILGLILRTIRKKFVAFLKRRADDKLLVNFGDSIMHIIFVVFLILLFLYILGFGGIAGSILGAASLSAFVIGFALKDIGENFLAGVIMAFDRPFRLGDTVKTGDVEGSITQMNLRDTHIKTFDGKDVYVPNGQIIKNPLYNYTIDGFMRGNFIVGIDYGEDVEKTREIILDVLKRTPGVLGDPKPPRTHVKNLNVSTIDIEVHYWIDTFNKNFSGLEVKSNAQSEIVKALTAQGIGLPADIIEIKNYDDSLKMESNTDNKTIA